MWFRMASEQTNYELSDRLIRVISNWQTFSGPDDDVEDLIMKGADVNRLHGTLLPLHCACMVSDSYILRLLLQKGARVNEIDGYERSAIHYAAERDVVCLEILLENGADINVGDGNQDTPLHWATYKNNIPCVRYLLQNGATVDPLDYNNDTPLGWAARKGHLEVINILLEYNADPHIENLRGNTPVDRAVQIQTGGLNTETDDTCLEVLLRASCKLNLTQSQRVTVEQDNRLSEMMASRVTTPCSLQGHCRYSIRKCFGYRYLPNVIPKLPVPVRLQDFITLDT